MRSRPEHRAACVAAINAFRQSHGFLPLVITSRTAEYEALAKPLRLQGAILVRPLTREQVNAYLNDLGPAGEPVRSATPRRPVVVGTPGFPVAAEHRHNRIRRPAGRAAASERYRSRAPRSLLRFVRE